MKEGESVVNNDMPTDIQYKDQLRKDLINYELIVELIKNGNTEKAVELLNKNIDRINASLQD